MFDSALFLILSLFLSGMMAAAAMFLEETMDQLIAISISATAFFPIVFAVTTVLVGD